MKSNAEVNDLIDILDAATEPKIIQKHGVEENAIRKAVESKAPLDLTSGKEKVGDSTEQDRGMKHLSLETEDPAIITCTEKKFRPFAMKNQTSGAETGICYGDQAYGDNADRDAGLESMEMSLNGPLPRVMIVAAVAAAACFAVLLYFQGFPGEWLYDFFYHRSYVQWVSLTLFFMGLFSLFHRLKLYLREKKALRIIETNVSRNAFGSVVYRRWQAVRAHLKIAPAHEVKGYAAYSAEDEVGDLDAGYSLIRLCVGALPLIGFFGTVLGLSRGLHDVGTDSQNMAHFTTAISTAFDTTLLGIGCALALLLMQYPIRKAEKLIVESTSRKINRLIHEKMLEVPEKADAERTLWEKMIGDVRKGLDALIKEITAQSRQSLEAFKNTMTEGMSVQRTAVGKLVKNVEQTASKTLHANVERIEKAADEAAKTVQAEILTRAIQKGMADSAATISALDKSLMPICSYLHSLQDVLELRTQDQNDISMLAADMKEGLGSIHKMLGEIVQQLQHQPDFNILGSSMKDELIPIRTALDEISQRNGHDAQVISTAIHDNTQTMCKYMTDVFNRPRLIRVVDQPIDERGEE